MRSFLLAGRIWLAASITFGIGWLVYNLVANDYMPFWTCIIATLASLVGSIPVLVSIIIFLPIIKRVQSTVFGKTIYIFFVSAFWCVIYGTITSFVFGYTDFNDQIIAGVFSTTALLACTAVALLMNAHSLNLYLNTFNQSLFKNKKMETTNLPSIQNQENPKRSNRILINASITGALILIMLIPTIFITNLVKERKTRQAEVVTEVSDRWAQPQVLTGPYIYLPYKIIHVDKDKKISEEIKHLTILPDVLDVNGQLSTEIRLRSIYKVLLYRADLRNSGSFQFKIPKEVGQNIIQWQDAKICYGLSDFKGIEEKLLINLDGKIIELSPGLPSTEISDKGLSAAILLSAMDSERKIPFTINLKIKGSEKLHFVPLAGDSRFTLTSGWASPSFDGNNLPTIRTVNKKGFEATWSFNKANLPFSTLLNDFKYDLSSIAFGVTMVQPADAYAKTDRSIKYAILFIGLTFSLFFIIELLQKKSVHPVQYILIGLALIIFYTLLLSISEFMLFDLSYLIAASATILLITFYAYGHFKSAKTAGIFGLVLSMLYGFTYVLIQMEDTALLLGSIGLFIILALAMYASRKINWYGEGPISEEKNLVECKV
ncbi:MAG: cell envelope integrity protein CreD [Ginsengibacter sp.]